MGSFGSSKIFQESVEILRNLPILTGDQTEELAKALKTLLEWTNMSDLRVAVFPVYFLGFVQVKLGETMGSLVDCLLPALVPGNPRTNAF